MRLTFKSSVVATLTATLLCTSLSLYGYGANNTKSIRSFANIMQANAALLDHAVATVGTTVFAGDTLQKDPTGSAMMQVRGSQIYLPNDSAVKLEDGGPALMRASLLRGAAGFLSGPNELAEIDCNEVTVHSRPGVAARGHVALVNPTELLVQSIHGDFDITFDGVTQTIENGKAYKAVISQSTGTVDGRRPTARKNNHRELTLAIAVAASEIVVFWYINKRLTESPSKPPE